MGRQEVEGERSRRGERWEGRKRCGREEGHRKGEGRRGKRGVLYISTASCLTCSMYCQYLKYDASQGV